MSGTRAISTTSRRELSSFFFLQGKAPKEINAILTETLACIVPGRARDLSAPLYLTIGMINSCFRKGTTPRVRESLYLYAYNEIQNFKRKAVTSDKMLAIYCRVVS